MTNSAVENKLNRIITSLKNFQLTHLKPFVDKYGVTGEQVTSQLTLSISMGLKKYEIWAKKKKGPQNRTHFKKH